ncbi:hypothetical protein [Leifsonia shinshuensis]|uniref:hypothetical protein n=1 Tax=Leifsonia shinshuensis TaxID=150026 RepID=UPI0021565A53|nr:hypothetical protein [Leifsonia shinshuensis]
MDELSDADSDSRDREAVERVRADLAEAARQLTEAGARDEALAVMVPRRRTFGIPREPVLRPAGRVWRLGVLLLGRDGTLYATGQLVRATPPGRTQYVSVSAETRRAYRAAAERGHFRDGETVDFDAPEIELTAAALRASTGPLVLRDGQALVRWSASSEQTVDAHAYLTERVELLAHPPQGA